MAEEFACCGVDDADVEVGDDHDDRGAGAGAADADVVEAAVVAQGDSPGGVDAVVADAVVQPARLACPDSCLAHVLHHRTATRQVMLRYFRKDRIRSGGFRSSCQ